MSENNELEPQERDIVTAVLKRIGEQPEFAEAWKNMLNAERSYLAGDLYNIINSPRPASSTDALTDLIKYAIAEFEEARLSDNEREMRIHLEYTNKIADIIRQPGV